LQQTRKISNPTEEVDVEAMAESSREIIASENF
jgi:hypothetical protein